MGIRDLKQNPTTAVAWAKAGDEVFITERGVEVAKLVAIQQSPLQELALSGEIEPPTGNLEDLLAELRPVPLPAGSPDSSQLLRESREDKF